MKHVFAHNVGCSTEEEAKEVQAILYKLTGTFSQIIRINDDLPFRILHDFGELKMSQILLRYR